MVEGIQSNFQMQSLCLHLTILLNHCLGKYRLLSKGFDSDSRNDLMQTYETLADTNRELPTALRSRLSNIYVTPLSTGDIDEVIRTSVLPKVNNAIRKNNNIIIH